MATKVTINGFSAPTGRTAESVSLDIAFTKLTGITFQKVSAKGSKNFIQSCLTPLLVR